MIALLAAGVLAQPAIAQTAAASPAKTPAAKASEIEVQELVVTGYAGSVRAANALKQVSDYALDAVNAEDIGKFPNRNAAEALQLVPGVTMDRQRGEGLYVSIRGLGPQFQNVTLNGSTIAVNELIENGGAQGRYFRFEVLPTDAISQLVVVKSPTAAMDDGALGGNIDVKTLKPLDVGTRGALSARASYNDKRGDTDPSVSGFYSYANPDRTFGVLVSGMYDKRSVRNDRFMNFGWNLDQFKSVLGTGLYTPTRTRPTIELEDRKRVSGVASVQWQPTHELKTELNLMATRLDVDYDEYGLDIYPDAGVGYPNFGAEKALYPSLGSLYDTAEALRNGRTVYAAPAFVAGSQVIKGNTVVAGTINNVRWMASHETSLNRHDLVAVNLNQLWTPGDWSFQGNYAYSKAHSYHPPGRATTRNRIAFAAPLTFDFSRGLHALPIMTTTVNYNDPNNYVGQAFDYTSKDSLDTDESGKFDAERKFAGPVTKLAAGAIYSHRNRDYVRRDWSINPVFGVPLTQLGSSFYSALPVTDFLSDLSGASPRTWVLPSRSAFYGLIYNSSVAARAPDAASLRSSFVVDEKIAAAYVMADFAQDIMGVPVSGNVGLRYAQTKEQASGTLVVGSAIQPVTYSKTYDNVLPSLNVKAEFSDTLVGRFAASRVVTRPNIVDVAPRITVSRDSPTASGGNPNLDPFMATQIDLGLEWYFSHDGALTGAVFYKKLDDFITQQNTTLNVPGRGDVLLSTTANGGAVKLKGLELSYNQAFTALPAPFGGLGTQASITYVDINSVYTSGNRVLNDKLIGLSKLSYNLLVYYQLDKLDARIGYFWRDKYLAGSGSTTSAESFVDSFGSLDGSIGYAVTPALSVSVDAINMLGAKKYVYGMDKTQVREINDYGRTVTLSARTKF